MTEGQVPEARWLTGDQLGWRGPWGTTYASNLRAYFSSISENEWVRAARASRLQSPMPSVNLRQMHPADLRALYRYVRSQGPAADAAPVPAFVPPGQEPAGPAVNFPMPPQ